jgi:hypothetical protein
MTYRLKMWENLSPLWGAQCETTFYERGDSLWSTVLITVRSN